MKVLNVRSHSLRLCGFFVLGSLGCLQVAHAAGGFSKAEATGSAKISWDSGVITQNAGWTPSTVSNNPSGPPSIKGQHTGTIGGKPLVIDVDAKVVPSSAKAGLLKAMKLAPVVGNIINAVELTKWAADTIGVKQLEVKPDGSAIQYVDSLSCTFDAQPGTNNCFKFSPFGPGGTTLSGPFMSLQSACQSEVGLYYYAGYTTTASVVAPWQGQTAYCLATLTNSSGSSYQALHHPAQHSDGTGVTVTQATPLTQQQLADKIALESGWPASSSAAISKALTYPDVQIATETPVISGPTSITGASTGSTTTVTNPDGTTLTKTETKTPTYNITYAGDSYSYTTTNVTNSTTTNNTTNETTTTTTTETTEDPCKLNPNSLACSTYGSPDSPTVSKSTAAISITPLTLSSGGGCPAPLPLSVFGQSYSISYSPACTAAQYLRFLVLAIAAVMAGYVFVEGLKS